jgi:uncharacterized membrane protein YqiK
MRLALIVLCVLASLGIVEASASAYTVGPPSPGLIEGTERIAKEAVEKREHEEAEAAAKKTAEERATGEARERQEHEHAASEANLSREKTEQEASKTPSPSVCRVPRLKGHSLAAARRLLSDAHCVLGRVRGRHAGRVAQLILSQGVVAGSTRPAGTPVAVTLGRRK